ncbi:FAD-binding oxidoreductase [Pseudoxanthomonas sp. 10H]|uniref:FAD-binding oxidoreductase n=1 Tax=Pseudoxanthomonas sp. 10H TaxID=3242729 RepID=UPI0035562C38
MTKRSAIGSWGRYPRVDAGTRVRLGDRTAALPPLAAKALPYGNGRSYGDSCLNPGGVLLHTAGLDRFAAFDPATGVLDCEAGVLLADVIDLVLPRGWFLPVTPGTRFVTVGGAIANDVHGKNHAAFGSFGDHVLDFELLRSDGTRRTCSPASDAALFRATVGGLGLTGVVVRARLQLRPVQGPAVEVETRRFGRLADFFALSADTASSEYRVAWVDCLARGAALGRGVYSHGAHVAAEVAPPRTGRLSMPFVPPFSLVNGASLRAFNQLYYRRAPAAPARYVQHYAPFFYPLDGIAHWNRMYGPRGFLQYQCVVPPATGEAAVAEILDRIAASGQGSFLGVLKAFGDRQAPGLLSFARPGTTLALDFPFRGKPTLDLLEALDRVVVAAGGAVYPAKDARMSPATFAASFPGLARFHGHRDPAFSSGFWRRVTGQA